MESKKSRLKSERLKKLEVELEDLQKWLEMGMVPKSDQTKHKEEIKSVRKKIEEEIERLQQLKESGDLDAYIAPKRSQGKASFELGPDMDMSQDDYPEADEDYVDEEDEGEEDSDDSDEDDPFNDRNRWRRGGIIDPDADDW